MATASMPATDVASHPSATPHAARIATGLAGANALLEAQNAALRRMLREREVAERRRGCMLRASQALIVADSEDAILAAVSDAAVDLACASGAEVVLVDRPDGALVADDLAWDADVPGVLVAPLRAASVPTGNLRLHDVPRPLAPGVADDLLVLAWQAGAALVRVRALHEAHRQAGIAQAVLDAAPDAIVLVDDAGRDIACNPGYRESRTVLGPLHPAHVSPHQIAALEDADAYVAELTRLASAVDETSVWEYRHGTPARTVVRYTAPVTDAAGGRLGRVFVHRDVTAERRALQARDDFLALVSHELRTPLTSVVGYLELLTAGEAGDLSHAQRGAVDVAHRNALRLHRMVGDLLTVAQARAGGLALVPHHEDVAALARHAVASAVPAARARGIHVSADLPDAPVYAVVDGQRVGQVLDNLLGNAIAYCCADDRVDVTVRQGDHDVEIRVADSGPGIPAAERERVFGAFQRGDGSRGLPGSGLGLAISRAIVEAHGGTLVLDPATDRGAHFTARLPLAAADTSEKGP